MLTARMRPLSAEKPTSVFHRVDDTLGVISG
jgi:hypothetical protein